MHRSLAFLALLLPSLFLVGQASEVKSDLEGDWRVVGIESGERTACSQTDDARPTGTRERVCDAARRATWAVSRLYSCLARPSTIAR